MNLNFQHLNILTKFLKPLFLGTESGSTNFYVIILRRACSSDGWNFSFRLSLQQPAPSATFSSHPHHSSPTTVTFTGPKERRAFCSSEPPLKFAMIAMWPSPPSFSSWGAPASKRKRRSREQITDNLQHQEQGSPYNRRDPLKVREQRGQTTKKGISGRCIWNRHTG